MQRLGTAHKMLSEAGLWLLAVPLIGERLAPHQRILHFVATATGKRRWPTVRSAAGGASILACRRGIWSS